MLSRVADAIYWISRYVERAENVARFIDVNFNLLLDSPTSQRQDWAPLVLTTGDQEWFAEHYGEPTPENVMRFLTFDRRYPNSIVSSIVHARENAQTVREIISREMFAELNMLYLTVTDAARKNEPFEEMASFYDRVRLAGNYYQGVTDATLSRGEAWHFSRLARLLERADKTSRILDVKYFTLLPTVSDIGSTYDQVGWAALLNSASALQMYRQAYQELAPSHVAEFLILGQGLPAVDPLLRCVGATKPPRNHEEPLQYLRKPCRETAGTTSSKPRLRRHRDNHATRSAPVFGSHPSSPERNW